MSEIAVDSKNPILEEVRKQIADIVKQVDEWVVEATRKVAENEQMLDRKIKEYATLEDREQKLKEDQGKLFEERRILDTEKKANEDFKLSLDRQKEELAEKLSRVQSILH